MANISLYPPVLENTSPAFIVNNNDNSYCRIYFSLSKLSTYEGSIKSIHISVINQKTGQNVINKVDNPNKRRFRKTGIVIINKSPVPVANENNLYYVDILNEDIQGGWNAGTIYKIQLRLSSVIYVDSTTTTQSTWLKNNTNNFSEWTSYCITKATAKPRITIPILKGFDSEDESNKNNTTKVYNFSSSTTLEMNGTYRNEVDPAEVLYSYQFQLYAKDENTDDKLGKLFEDSQIIYAEQYSDQEQYFHYLFKRDLQSIFDENKDIVKKSFLLIFNYSTINGLTGSYSFDLNISQAKITNYEVYPYIIENFNNLPDENLDNIKDENGISIREKANKETSVSEEVEEGRIGLKLYSSNIDVKNTNFCLRRADSREDYKIWTDIKIIPCDNNKIYNLPVIFDNTIESGVWYKYGIQIINENGERSYFYINDTPVMREFNYSYLIGEGGKQLKLKYNNTMSSYQYNYSDTKTDTIGGKYPYITRNGNMKYRSFPINGLITFNMDETNLFTSDKEIYGDVIANNYKNWRKENNIDLYDFRREFDFREKVLEFLQDGKPKLFKSATEGNIIVRLMNVAAQPEQSLNRMIYSFTSNAFEIADNTMDNYLKYGFYSVGKYKDSFSATYTYLGQIDDIFYPNKTNKNNIITRIWEAYDNKIISKTEEESRVLNLSKIHHVKITFESKPFKIKNSSNKYLLGYNILYGDELISTNAKYTNIYQFEENIVFDKNSILLVQGSDEDDYNGKENETVHIIVDFLYDVSSDLYKAPEKIIDTEENGIGQIYGNYKSKIDKDGENTVIFPVDLYSEIKRKFAYTNGTRFRELKGLEWVCIEAEPNTVFYIKDTSDKEKFIINHTGILNLEGLGFITGLEYEGVMNPITKEIEAKRSHFLIDYMYYIEEGTYS